MSNTKQVFIETDGGQVEWDGQRYDLPTTRTRVEDSFRDANGKLVAPSLAHVLAAQACKKLNGGKMEDGSTKAPAVRLTIEYSEVVEPTDDLSVQVASLSARLAEMEAAAGKAIKPPIDKPEELV